MTKPDFRAAVKHRLASERRADLPDRVLRLITPGQTAEVAPDYVQTPDVDPAGPTAPAQPTAATGLAAAAEPAAPAGRPNRGRPLAVGPAGQPDRRRATPTAGTPVEPPIDPLTGFLSGCGWQAILRREEGRLERYGQPVTLLVTEIDGFGLIADRFGDVAAERLIVPVAAAIRNNTRASDILARVGRARFVALLAETPEVAASGHVARVRGACNSWFEEGGLSARLAAGWAQPARGRPFGEALAVAEARLESDRLHGGTESPARG